MQHGETGSATLGPTGTTYSQGVHRHRKCPTATPRHATMHLPKPTKEAPSYSVCRNGTVSCADINTET